MRKSPEEGQKFHQARVRQSLETHLTTDHNSVTDESSCTLRKTATSHRKPALAHLPPLAIPSIRRACRAAPNAQTRRRNGRRIPPAAAGATCQRRATYCSSADRGTRRRSNIAITLVDLGLGAWFQRTNIRSIHHTRNNATMPPAICTIQSPTVFGLPKLNMQQS
jgi:hypothetical protein